jgi:hypothetical protein
MPTLIYMHKEGNCLILDWNDATANFSLKEKVINNWQQRPKRRLGVEGPPHPFGQKSS